MAGTLVRGRRCTRCGSALFVSEDILDVRGEVYCLSGHRFYPEHFEVIDDAQPIGRAPQRRRSPSHRGVAV